MVEMGEVEMTVMLGVMAACLATCLTAIWVVMRVTSEELVVLDLVLEMSAYFVDHVTMGRISMVWLTLRMA